MKKYNAAYLITAASALRLNIQVLETSLTKASATSNELEQKAATLSTEFKNGDRECTNLQAEYAHKIALWKERRLTGPDVAARTEPHILKAGKELLTKLKKSEALSSALVKAVNAHTSALKAETELTQAYAKLLKEESDVLRSQMEILSDQPNGPEAAAIIQHARQENSDPAAADTVVVQRASRLLATFGHSVEV